jgi:hypothetical protein
MTWIGKILAVFVLIVGVAAMWFMAQVFVTRNNWKNDRDNWAKLYKEAESARQAELSTFAKDKDALERQLVAEQSKSKGLGEQVAKLRGSNEAVAAENIRLAKTIKDNDVTAVDLQANYQASTDEARKLRERSGVQEKQIQQLTISAENSNRDRQAAENRAKQAESDKLLADARVESLTAQISELKATGGNASASVLNSFNKPPAPLPDGVRGTVTAYKDDYVALSIGIDAGLTNGATLDIFRSDGGGQYLGTVVVERVYPKEAVAKFKPADVRRSTAKLRADELPKVGDTVGKVGVSGPLGLK